MHDINEPAEYLHRQMMAMIQLSTCHDCDPVETDEVTAERQEKAWAEAISHDHDRYGPEGSLAAFMATQEGKGQS